MLEIAVALGPIGMLLVLSELLWRAKMLRGEAARKLLHIIIGSYVACWLYFLTFQEIEWLSLALLVGITVSHKFHIFHAISEVKRKSWGDIFYAIGLGVTAVLAKQPWLFALAVLHMSIADGLAGLIGTYYGKNNKYKVLGATKSVAGTLAFVATSFVLLLMFNHNHPQEITRTLLLTVPWVLAVVENLGFRGTDNLTIPVLIVLLFR